MKSYSKVLWLALALSACSSAVGPAPTPQPTQPPRAPAQPPARITVMPARWWMLDAEKDGVYGASVDRAYTEILNARQPRRTVVVAIIDSGIDITHEDLDGVLWTNTKETKNSRDDDNNGYPDDLSGWNFIGGRDGRHVNQDTYEVTRLFAACEKRFGAQPSTTPPPERVTKEECTKISADFRDKRKENEEMLGQVKELDVLMTRAVSILKNQLGTDSLTEARVRSLTALRNEIREAQQIYLHFAGQGVSPQMIKDEVKRIQELLEYGLNPAFDPRPIVGDNYANATERGYGNGAVTGPDASHGTGVAGIVAAERNNNQGVDGIATNARIMTIRAVPDGDERDKDIANAIRYAVDNGAHIINMSFGKAYSPEKGVVDEAVKYADEKGVLLIHAAGNDAKDLAVESNFPNRTFMSGGTARNWIEVGASDWRGREHLASDFSNYGVQQVDVFAPGSDITSTAPGNKYEPASGTSFAAPVVSGIAAMLMAYYPDLTATDVRRIILESATVLREQMVARPGEDAGNVRFGQLSVTGAIVNAYNAVRMAEQLSKN